MNRIKRNKEGLWIDFEANEVLFLLREDFAGGFRGDRGQQRDPRHPQAPRHILRKTLREERGGSGQVQEMGRRLEQVQAAGFNF